MEKPDLNLLRGGIICMEDCLVQEMAEAEGDTEKAEDVGLELQELELRAKELDNRRTSTISAIRSVLDVAFRTLHFGDLSYLSPNLHTGISDKPSVGMWVLMGGVIGRVDIVFDSCLKDSGSNPAEAGHCATTVG